MLAEMDVSYSDLTNAQAVQLVGLAVGCIVVIPCSQKYGRRSTYIFSTAVLAGVTWWAAYMRTNSEVMVTSVLFGLAGAPNEAVVQMTVRISPPHPSFFLLFRLPADDSRIRSQTCSSCTSEPPPTRYTFSQS